MDTYVMALNVLLDSAAIHLRIWHGVVREAKMHIEERLRFHGPGPGVSPYPICNLFLLIRGKMPCTR